MSMEIAQLGKTTYNNELMSQLSHESHKMMYIHSLQPINLPSNNFPLEIVSEIQPKQVFKSQGHYDKVEIK